MNSYQESVSVLTMSTLAFSACFAVWVIFSIIGIPIKEQLDLNETQFGILVAMPILSGSILRLPVGILTDRYGGRKVFVILLMAIVPPLYLVGDARHYWQFLILGLFVGVAGASFSVGVTYTARWFPPARRGLAMGIFGAGNAGAALTNFVAPTLLVTLGWQAVPKYYAQGMVVVIILFWLFTFDDPKHKNANNTTIKNQLSLLKNPGIWKYCQYYSLVFGGFVGLSLWITQYYISEYELDLTTAALVASVFVLPSGIVRALGGWLSDRFGAYIVTWIVLWVSWVCLFVLSYPQINLNIKVVSGDNWDFGVGLNIVIFTMLLFVLGMAWGVGKASVFKSLADEYPDNLGVASGIVGLVGGLGGFLLPILFGILIDITRVNSSVFVLLFGATTVSLVLMYFTFGREHTTKIIRHAKEEEADRALLSSMESVVVKQRELLQGSIEIQIKPFAQQLSSFINDRAALESELQRLKPSLENYKNIYVLNAKGVQITASITPDRRDEDRLMSDRSNRPYMEGMFSGKNFRLSEGYISRKKRQPSVTAIHTVRGNVDELMGFVGVDYSLSDLPYND